MRTIGFSFAEHAGITPSAPQYAGIQGDHNVTQVHFTLPQTWMEAGYRVRAEFVDGNGAFDTTGFLERSTNTVTIPLPCAWTAAGGLGEIRLAAAKLSAAGCPEEIVAYSPVGYVYFDSRSGEPSGWRSFENRGLSALIADCMAAAGEARDVADELRRAAESGAFDGTKWWFGTVVGGKSATVTAAVEGARRGDTYLNTATYTVYVLEDETAGEWRYLGCLRGEKGAKGDKGDPGRDGVDGYGLLKVTQTIAQSDGRGGHLYEVYATDYETLPERFLLWVYLHYGMTESDWGINLYGQHARLVGFSLRDITPSTCAPGYHLYAYENGKLYEIKGEKGDTGEAGMPEVLSDGEIDQICAAGTAS